MNSINSSQSVQSSSISWLQGLANSIFDFHFKEQALPLMGFLRILFALVLLFQYAIMIPDLVLLFGPQGIGGADFASQFPANIGISRPPTMSLHLPEVFASTAVLVSLFALTVASLLLFAAGLFTRISGVIALFLHALFHARFEYVYWGWADLIVPLMAYVIMSPSCRLYSVDQYLRKLPSSHPSLMSELWPLRLIQFHVSVMYFVVSFSRLSNPAWLDGSMVYRILDHTLFSRVIDLAPALQAPINVLSSGSWYLELLAPILLWIKPTRLYTALALIVMHIGLELTAMVGGWNFVMIGGLLAFVELKSLPYIGVKFRSAKT